MHDTTITKLQLGPLDGGASRAQSSVTIYTLAACPFCRRAKSLLEDNDVNFHEQPLDDDDSMRAWVMEQSGGRKVFPQIFVGNRHIGGFYELKRFHQLGTLKLLVSRA